MIWIRRLLTIPLGLLFLVLLVLTLILFRVSETLLEPEFYKEQLREAEVYDFILDDLLRSTVDELRSKDPDFFTDNLEENPLVTLSLSTDEIVSSVQAVLPPSWVQTQVEQVLDQIGGYITGESDTSEILITVAERVGVTIQEIKALLLRDQLYDILFDEIVAPEIREALEDEGALPFDLSLTSEDIISAVQEVASREWVLGLVEQALDEVTAYVAGDKETFQINVQLGDRTDTALAEIGALLKKANFSELVFDQVVDPMLEGSIAAFTELPFGVTITEEEVRLALRELVPPSWLEEQVLGVIDEAGPYLTGQEDTFQAVIPLSERKGVALNVIEELANAKLQQLVAEIPECGEGLLPLLGVVPSLNELPQCVPPGIQVETLIDSLDIDVTESVREMIGSQIPDQIAYTEADLRRSLTDTDDADTTSPLDKMREVLSEGFTYTDADLREDLMSSQDGDSVELLDDVRAALSEGFTYTDVDLRQDLTDADDAAILDNLDDFRAQLGRARDLRFLVYVVWGLLLLIIGALAGRRWVSRFAWAAFTLGVSAALVFVASGPVYTSLGQSEIDDLRVEVLEDLEGTQLMAAEKGLDVLQAVADDFLSGIESSSLTLLIIALVVLGISMVWPLLFGRSSRARG